MSRARSVKQFGGTLLRCQRKPVRALTQAFPPSPSRCVLLGGHIGAGPSGVQVIETGEHAAERSATYSK
jgi:hypothetical protein